MIINVKMKLDSANFAERSAEIGCHGESGIYCSNHLHKEKYPFCGAIGEFFYTGSILLSIRASDSHYKFDITYIHLFTLSCPYDGYVIFYKVSYTLGVMGYKISSTGMVSYIHTTEVVAIHRSLL